MDEVKEYAAERGIDVLLLQEPYVSRGKLAGMPFTATVVLGVGPNDPSPPMAAIVVLTPGLEVTKLTQFCTTHTVVAELAGTSVILVSQYYQFMDETMPCRAQLTSLMTSVRDRDMIVAADCNARSPLWGSPDSCQWSKSLLTLTWLFSMRESRAQLATPAVGRGLTWTLPCARVRRERTFLEIDIGPMWKIFLF